MIGDDDGCTIATTTTTTTTNAIAITNTTSSSSTTTTTIITVEPSMGTWWRGWVGRGGAGADTEWAHYLMDYACCNTTPHHVHRYGW